MFLNFLSLTYFAVDHILEGKKKEKKRTHLSISMASQLFVQSINMRWSYYSVSSNP